MTRFKLFLVAGALVAIWFIIIADTALPEKIILQNRMSATPIRDKSALRAPSMKAACTMAKHSGTAASYWSGYEINTGTYTYFDPAVQCGAPAYPFEITNFSFTLYDPGGYVWPVVLDIVVYDLPATANPCDGLGAELCRFTITADQATFGYPNVATVTFPGPCCVSGPFFIGLEYLSGQNGSTPSVLFDDTPAPDTCDNWQFYIDGGYYEWYDFWAPPVSGYPIFWVDGETQSANCGPGPCLWNPGDPHKMHFPQLPDEAGWDVNATWPVTLGDDFRCTQTGPITDIHFWGSWKDGIEGQIDGFLFEIYEDIPADQSPTGYSIPGALLWQMDATIDQVNVIGFDPPTPEGWYDPAQGLVLPNNHQAYFQYNFCIDEANAFIQQAGTIYWLVISAFVNDPSTMWGWKSTQDRFNDDAVVRPSATAPWTDMWEPSEQLEGGFAIQIDPSGNFISGFGDPAFGQGWYFYDPEQWWNIWFYDHPFAPDNRKIGYLEFDLFPLTTSQPMAITVALNWSTDQWSIDQPPTDSSPPLPGVDEALYIGRQILFSSDQFAGHYGPFSFEILDYNPEWVSVDVRGYNFDIPSGFIIHECQPSLNLAFVITGSTTPEEPEACCLPDGTCQDLLPSVCLSIGGTPQGLGTVCSGALEACCLADGTCMMADPLCCQNELGGTPMGVGSSCSAAAEACCMPDGTCQMLDPLCCENLGGTPQGSGTQCTTFEACCLPDGSCIMIDPLCCDDLGGSPQGPGSQCSANTEACCFADGSCKDLDPLCCVDQGGTPQGAGSFCLGDADGDGNDDACQPDYGACCFPDGTCLVATEADCLAQNGTYIGDGTICLGDNNGNGIDDQCDDPWNPDDGHKMHYPQLPDEAGWDVNASFPWVIADDWQCSETGWVKDIHFWGSWLDGDESYGGIMYFTISIHEDIPASPTNPYSHPGTLLWEYPVSNFKATRIIPPTLEGYYDPFGGIVLPDNHQEYYQYDVYLPEDRWFHQDSGTVYWLNITAHVENPTSPGRWGWKSSIEHFNDDAVFGGSTSTPCVTPDQTLPAPCSSSNPDTPWIIDNELIPGGWIEIWPTVGTPRNIVRTPMAEYDIVEYEADVMLEMHGMGSLAGFLRNMSLPASFMIREYPPQDAVSGERTVQTEILSMDLSGFGDPDFDMIQIMSGENHSLPSPGTTVLTELPDGTWNVDSFFDVEYRIDFQGAPGSVLEGTGGTSQGGPARLQQGGAMVNDWTELYEPPNFEQSMDMAFVITGDKGQICDCIPGDANGDGTVNVGDAVYLIAYVFNGGPTPIPYRICSGDANCDCQVNVGDAVFVISYVFKQGPAPCDCPTWLSLCGPPLRK